VLALATGGGKTVVASHLIKSAADKGRTSMFVVDRIVLVEQAAKHLRNIGLSVGIYQGENTVMHTDNQCVVASIQSIGRRGLKNAPGAGFIIIDECHILHAAHVEMMDSWNALPVIGLSATPLRDGLADYFTNLVRGPGIGWLTENGFLCPVKAYAPTHEALARALEHVSVSQGDYASGELSAAVNDKVLIGDIVSTWRSKADGLKTICFAVDIAHSKSIRDVFQADGINAAHIDCHMSDDKRDEIMVDFRAGKITVLCSVGILTTGFDEPDIRCGILARPTLSLMLAIQQMGRLIRTAPGKTEAIIMDHSGNTLRHGLPGMFEVPGLKDNYRIGAKQAKKQKKCVACEHCGYVLEADDVTCPGCGLDRPVKTSKVINTDDDLTEFGMEPVAPDADEKKQFYLELKWHGKAHGFKLGYAIAVFVEKYGEFPSWGWRDLEAIPPGTKTLGYLKYKRIRYAKGHGRQRRTNKTPSACKNCGSTKTCINDGTGAACEKDGLR